MVIVCDKKQRLIIGYNSIYDYKRAMEKQSKLNPADHIVYEIRSGDICNDTNNLSKYLEDWANAWKPADFKKDDE